MHIIGAGFGRTGTMSLCAALEKLGYAPCYHMLEIFKHPTLCKNRLSDNPVLNHNSLENLAN